MKKQAKIPVILYESEEQSLPYIEIEQDDNMPDALFIQEYKHTGDYEPDEEGEEAPIVDILMHMYVNMTTLQNKLPADLNDKVRVAIGLQPLAKAKAEGQKIMDRVYGNVNKRMEDTHANKEQLKEELGRHLNEKLNEKFFKTEEVEEE